MFCHVQIFLTSCEVRFVYGTKRVSFFIFFSFLEENFSITRFVTHSARHTIFFLNDFKTNENINFKLVHLAHTLFKSFRLNDLRPSRSLRVIFKVILDHMFFINSLDVKFYCNFSILYIISASLLLNVFRSCFFLLFLSLCLFLSIF